MANQSTKFIATLIILRAVVELLKATPEPSEDFIIETMNMFQWEINDTVTDACWLIACSQNVPLWDFLRDIIKEIDVLKNNNK